MVDITVGDHVKTPDDREGDVIAIEGTLVTVAFEDGTHQEYKLEEIRVL